MQRFDVLACALNHAILLLINLLTSRWMRVIPWEKRVTRVHKTQPNRTKRTTNEIVCRKCTLTYLLKSKQTLRRSGEEIQDYSPVCRSWESSS